jgi:hypothetical protein
VGESVGSCLWSGRIKLGNIALMRCGAGVETESVCVRGMPSGLRSAEEGLGELIQLVLLLLEMREQLSDCRGVHSRRVHGGGVVWTVCEVRIAAIRRDVGSWVVRDSVVGRCGWYTMDRW